MCYALPGPRCGNHARKARDKAVALLEADDRTNLIRTQELKDRALKARIEYFSTAEALAEMRRQHEADPELVSAAVLEHWTSEHQSRIDAYKDSKAYKARLEDIDDDTYDRLRTVCEDRDRAQFTAHYADDLETPEGQALHAHLLAEATEAKTVAQVEHALVGAGIGSTWQTFRPDATHRYGQVKWSGASAPNLAVWEAPSPGFPHGRIHRLGEVTESEDTPGDSHASSETARVSVLRISDPNERFIVVDTAAQSAHRDDIPETFDQPRRRVILLED